MDRTTKIVRATLAALKEVRHPRFFENERGYQGQLYCQLQAQLRQRGLLDGGAILELEYQKSSRHGTGQRPDIVFHIPAGSHDRA